MFHKVNDWGQSQLQTPHVAKNGIDDDIGVEEDPVGRVQFTTRLDWFLLKHRSGCWNAEKVRLDCNRR